MSEMSFHATLLATHDINTPFKVFYEIHMGALFKSALMFLDEGLQFREELFNWIQVW
jgi:hypothetical protein